MPAMHTRRLTHPVLPLLALALLLVLVFFTYWPGLHGTFLLDGWGTLPKLGAYGPVNNFNTLISYLTSGTAGPGGRPLSLASFLIDARNWPAPAWPFKLTNVLLQLVNGALLAWLLAKLTRYQGLNARTVAWAGVLGAGVWMAHPLFVSTTLYVVQRMAMLAAFFVFAGLITYVSGREQLNRGRTRRGYALMTLGIVGGTVLGFFSKENAMLLPVLAGVLELSVLRYLPQQLIRPLEHRSGNAGPALGYGIPKRPALPFRAIFLWLPALVIFAYLAWWLRDVNTVTPGRDFTVGMRLLTEARVLVTYLYLLLVPHSLTHGLYTQFPLSHGLLHPWTTLPSILLLLALVIGAFSARKRHPVIAAAVLFFFAGQLLESTTPPLELYYEHRNYLPAALLFWPLALWWARGPGPRYLRFSSAGLAFAVLLSLTFLRASLWGSPDRQALTWMRLNPYSVRAVVAGTDTLERQGHTRLAYAKLHQLLARKTDSISLALASLASACELGAARTQDVDALVHAAGYDWTGSQLLYNALSGRLEGKQLTCPGFGISEVARVIARAQQNPHYHGNRVVQQNLLLLQARVFLHRRDYRAASTAFRQALLLHAAPAVALTGASELLASGDALAARRLLADYRSLPRRLPPLFSMSGLHRRWLDHIGWYEQSFHHLDAAIREALRHRHRRADTHNARSRKRFIHKET